MHTKHHLTLSTFKCVIHSNQVVPNAYFKLSLCISPMHLTGAVFETKSFCISNCVITPRLLNPHYIISGTVVIGMDSLNSLCLLILRVWLPVPRTTSLGGSSYSATGILDQTFPISQLLSHFAITFSCGSAALEN